MNSSSLRRVILNIMSGIKNGTEVHATYMNFDDHGIVAEVSGVQYVIATDADISFRLDECSEVTPVTGIERVNRGYVTDDRTEITLRKYGGLLNGC